MRYVLVLVLVAGLLGACGDPPIIAPPVGTASGVTGPPADMTGINSMHRLLRAEDSRDRKSVV